MNAQQLLELLLQLQSSGIDLLTVELEAVMTVFDREGWAEEHTLYIERCALVGESTLRLN